MTVKESDRVKELESKIKIIEAENELLAEYKEELFLMGQVSEILSTTDSVEEITDALLERTAILKNIPFCAFGEIKDSEIYIGKFYTLFSEEESLEPALFLSENEISELENGVWVCNENSDIKEPRFKSNFSGFQAKGILILPVHVHEIQRSFFLFVDNQRSAEELRLLLPLLHRLCDMSAERMNNIYLLARLKEANENLEKKVDEQTGELRNANIELKKRIAKYQLTRSALQESEKLMRTIAENFPNSFVSIINNDYTVKFSSGQEFKKLGLNPNDYDGLSVDQIFGDKAALVKKHYKKTFEGKEQTFSLFLNNQHQLYKTVPLLNEGDRADQILAVVENITERKNAESALKESEEKFRNLVEQSPFAFQIFDKDGNLLQVNEAWENMWGVNAEQVIGRYNALKDEQIKAAGLLPMLERAVNGENVILPDVEYDPAKSGMPGQKCWARTYAYSIKDSAGKIKNVIVVNEDISKRKSAEKALRESEERYRYFVQQTAEGFFRIKTDNPIPAALPFEKQLELYLKEMYVAECNDIFARMYGYPQAEHLNGRKLTELHGGENFTDNAGGSISFIQNGYKMIDAETQEFDKDGKKVYFLNNAVGIIKDDCLIEIWGTQRNITKRKLAEEAVQESEAKYRSLIQHSSDAIYLLYNRRFEVVNDKFLEMFKVDLEYVNSPDFNIMNLVAPHSHHILEERQARLDRGEKIEPKYEFTALTSEGDEFQVEASISYIDYKDGAAAQGIIRDITEAKKLEEQLRQSQKMDAVGQLAGGIAHDFNNLLTIISGYSDLLLNTQGVDVNSIEKLNQIRKAGERAQSLTNQLLAFSRRQIVRPEVLDINKVLNDSMKMYSRLIGEDIKIRLMLGENLPSILADPHQIEQILMNLLVNARDAIHAKYQENFEKIITIETSLRYLDEEYAAVHLGCKAGRKIMICISDTGAGMSKETIERVFEPFYTTKSQGKGTGLGMSTVYGIVKQNEANIYVYSEPGQGSTFKIFWPLNEAETEENDLEPREMKIIGGSEKILFVEDDDGVREFGLNALLNLGYDVQPAASAEAAMELIQTNKIDFDILITDLVMPGMSGRQLADKIQQLYKDLPVIFVSGYTDEHIVHHGVLDKDINFIQKPYSIAALAAKIRELLDD